MKEKKKDILEEEDTEEDVEEESLEESTEDTEESAEEGKKDRFGRVLYKTKCSDCGKETEVPFKPSGDRPVYCRECYQKRKPKRF